jgi:hypothetical protein
LGSESLDDYAAGFEIWAAGKGDRAQKLPIPEKFQMQAPALTDVLVPSPG